jgi:hydroxypyruvate isomerase
MFTIDFQYKGLNLSSRFPWKIGIVSFMAFPSMMKGEGDIPGFFKKIGSDPFFELFEVCALTEDRWNQIKPFLAGKFVARGLQPELLTRKLDLNSMDSMERAKAIDYVKEEIDIAARRGISNLALCSGPDPGEELRGKAHEILVKSLKEICGYAASRGVTILLENFDREYDKRLLIGPTEEALDVIRKVRSEHANIGLLWDLSHAPMLSEDPKVLRNAASLLSHVHIGCTKEFQGKLLDTHPVFYTPGAINTEVEVSSLLSELWNIGYKGMISFEVRPEEGQTSDGIIAQAKAALMDAYRLMLLQILKG